MEISSKFRPIHEYTINVGQYAIGTYYLYYNFNPEGKEINIPCRVKLEWNDVILDTGFRGDSSYDEDLIKLGFNVISSKVNNGSLILNKNQATPNKAKMTVYTPLEESLAFVKITCDLDCDLTKYPVSMPFCPNDVIQPCNILVESYENGCPKRYDCGCIVGGECVPCV